MKWWKDLVQPRRRENDLDEEIRAHIAIEIRRRIDAGESPETARIETLRELRSVEFVKEAVRDTWRGGLLARLSQYVEDLRSALQGLRRGRGFTAAVLVLLALGVGATTAIFSVVSGVLLRPLALPDPGQLVLIGERIPEMAQTAGLAWFDTPPAFLAWRQATDFIGMSVIMSSRLPVMGAGEPRLLHGVKTSPNFFDMLEVPAALGRIFEPADAQATSNPIIITDALWRTVFNADPTIIGRNIGMPGSSATVIGVLPGWFRLHGRELGPMLDGTPTEFFRPLEIGQSDLQRAAAFSDFTYHVIGRVRPGVTREQALAQLNVIEADLTRIAPEKLSRFADLITIQDFAVAGRRQELWLLLGGAGAVLLIICVNLGGLWISRLSDRQREWGIRAALGADPGRLARQVVYEGVVLGLIGGILGIGCAGLSLHTLLAAAPANLPRLDEVHLDGRVLAFGLALAVVSGLLTGLVPALRLGRLDPQAALSHASASAISGLDSVRSRQALLALQAAISTVLLTAAGLLGLSFYRLVSQPIGFMAQHAVEAEISLIDYSADQRLAILRQLPAAALALPGVLQAGFTTQLPLKGERGTGIAEVPGKVYTAAPTVVASAISPGYLAAVGVPLLAGRDLSEFDGDRNVIVISAAAARVLWPEDLDARESVGRTLNINDGSATIVGIVGDARSSLTAPPPPFVYLPFAVKGNGIPYSGSLVVRSLLPVEALSGPLRQAIGKFAPAAPISRLQGLDQLEAASVAPQRYQLTLLLLFAGLAVFLAALGVYAQVAQSVARRSKELAIRISLGASAATIWGAVMRQALGPPLLGLAVGLLAAVSASPLVSSLLFQVKPVNVAVLAAVAGTVVIAAVCACLGPARRATRVDPLRALRAE
jgi:putative ABC transport system permease protein